MKESKRTLIVFVVFAAVMCVGYLAWGQMNTAGTIYNAAIEGEGMDALLSSDEDFTPSGESLALLEETEAKRDRWLEENMPEEGYITADDGETELYCRFYDNGSDTTVVLLHAYYKDGDAVAVFAPFWSEKGYNLLIPDLRGHGDSGGFTSLGYYEPDDLAAVIDASCPGDRLILHGQGLGAATALMFSLSDGYEIDLIVAESSFTDLDSFAEYQIKRQFSLPSFPIMLALKQVVNSRMGFQISEIHPHNIVQVVDTPCLFVTGADAEFVPAYMSEELYEGSAAGEKKLLSVSGAGYLMAWAVDRQGYEDAIEEMLN